MPCSGSITNNLHSMVKATTYSIGTHRVELAESPTGSMSPWTLESVRELGENVVVSADMAWFVRIDGTEIYRVDLVYGEKDIDGILSSLTGMGEAEADAAIESMKQVSPRPVMYLEKHPTVEETINKIMERRTE